MAGTACEQVLYRSAGIYAVYLFTSFLRAFPDKRLKQIWLITQKSASKYVNDALSMVCGRSYNFRFHIVSLLQHVMRMSRKNQIHLAHYWWNSGYWRWKVAEKLKWRGCIVLLKVMSSDIYRKSIHLCKTLVLTGRMGHFYKRLSV